MAQTPKYKVGIDFAYGDDKCVIRAYCAVHDGYFPAAEKCPFCVEARASESREK